MSSDNLSIDLAELLENFELLDDWEDRYRYLIDLGKSLPALDDAFKTDSYKVRGCTSQVWLTHEVYHDDTQQVCLRFLADSDAFIVRGLVAILLIAYSNQPVQEIINLKIEDLFKQLGLERNLSFSRRNGFFSMVQKVRTLAKSHQSI
jgi:cysteine desulfuration protein SufE